MGRRRSTFTFEHKEFDARLAGMKPHIERRVGAIMAIGAAEAATYAKTTARWTDQTSAARNGLFAVSGRRGPGSYEIVLAHAVSYGIWLEVRWSGRYAIIEQTLRHVGGNVMGRMNKVLG